MSVWPSFLAYLVSLEDAMKALKEKAREPEAPEPEPEPTTEVLFLCSYEGCGKTFIDAGALRKHSHIHGERQYVCHYEGCGKVFQSFTLSLQPYPSLLFFFQLIPFISAFCSRVYNCLFVAEIFG